MALSPSLNVQWPGANLARLDIEALCLANLLQSDERVYFKDRESRFVFVSRGWLEQVAPHLSVDEVLGKTDFDIFSEPHAQSAFEDERHIIATGEPVRDKTELETYPDRPDCWVSTSKMPLRDGAGAIIGTFGISRDITARALAEKALAYNALHDPLTGLANRIAVMDRLTQALADLERHPGRVCVMFVDLDNFKEINDTYDHETGDVVLVEVAQRIAATIRRADTVARFGGDEFIVLHHDFRQDHDPCTVARRLVSAIGEPLVIEGIDLTINASVGLTVASSAEASPNELVKQADIAMYRAKRAGGGQAELFTGETHRVQRGPRAASLTLSTAYDAVPAATPRA